MRGVETVDKQSLNKYLYAFVLGDGCLENSKAGNSRLRIEHISKNIDYIQWKASILRELTNVTERTYFREDKQQFFTNIITARHSQYTSLRERLYLDSHKTIDPHTEAFIDWEFLAIVYQDDGTVYYNQHGVPQVLLCLENFTWAELKLLRDWFAKYLDLHWNIVKHNKTKYRLRLTTKFIPRMWNNIEPYIYPSFYYKIGKSECESPLEEDEETVRSTQKYVGLVERLKHNRNDGKAYKEFKPEHPDLFESYKSNKRYEEDVGISSFGLASVKEEGSPVSYDTEKQGFLTRYTHVEYALGFIITRLMMEDDLYDVVGQKRARGLAYSMRQTKEIVAANVYNRAFNSSYTGGDGKELCATDHPNVAGGTWQNELTTSADLSEASLEQMCIEMGKWENDRGLRINVMPQSLHIPVDLEFEAERILMSPYRVGTADNDINAMYKMGKFPKGVKVNHYFTDPDAFFIRTSAPDGMKHFQRRPLQFTIDNEFDTENAKFKATERYSFGWTDPRAIFGSPGAQPTDKP